MSESVIDLTTQSDNNYTRLKNILDAAFDQAASGKGHQRHGQDKAFEDQPMQLISELVNSPAGMAYQIIKKTQEAQRMDTDAAIRELLGVIVYAAGHIIYLEDQQ